MTPSCHWECRGETTSGASTDPSDSTTSTDSKEESFCVGGTDMYMRGFAVSRVKTVAVVADQLFILSLPVPKATPA